MENFKVEIWNRLYYDSKDVVAELQPTLDNHRRWLSIDKYKPEHPLAPEMDQIPPPHKYSIFDFELDAELVDEYFGDESIKNQKLRS